MAKLLIVAVAARAPDWAQAACAEYLKRMPRGLDTALVTVRPEPRSSGKPLERMLALEAARIRERLPRGARLVALDERGRELNTAQFAAQLRRWIDDGTPTASPSAGRTGSTSPSSARPCSSCACRRSRCRMRWHR